MKTKEEWKLMSKHPDHALPAHDASEVRTGVKADPIVQALQSMGMQVTVANYLTLDNGSPSTKGVSAERLASIKRLVKSYAHNRG